MLTPMTQHWPRICHNPQFWINVPSGEGARGANALPVSLNWDWPVGFLVPCNAKRPTAMPSSYLADNLTDRNAHAMHSQSSGFQRQPQHGHTAGTGLAVFQCQGAFMGFGNLPAEN
jgi:hypothetical protein